MSTDELRRRVHSRPWFHRIDLGSGIITPGVDDSPAKLPHIKLPEDLTGKTVIDVGAYDGFFSFEAERRGAERVVAADYFCWNLEGMATKEGFDIAHEALGSRVEDRMIRVEDLSPETVGQFDLVLYLGVLYHTPDPIRCLRRLRSICRERLILETHLDAEDYPRPAMVFYPGATLNNDRSNHWGPNRLAVKALLEEVGFSRVEVFEPHVPGRVVAHAYV